jgi:Tfp pilus assembly protein PilO
MRNSIQLFVSFAVSTIVLLFGIYVLFGLDLSQWQVVKGVRLKLAERQAVMDQLTSLISKFRERLASFDNLDKQANSINTALPDSLSVPELLVSLEAMALENQVNFESITFTSVDIQSNQTAAATKDAKKVKAIEPLPLQITISGSGHYGSVKGLMSALEQELRLIEVAEVSFRPSTPGSDGGAKKKTEEFGSVLEFQINATTYYIEKSAFTLP